MRRQSGADRDAYSAEVMFRIMLIQSWYQLSDYQMEEQLNYNRMIQDRTQFWKFEEIFWLG
ncbi:MAG: transposase [Atribacterota bacterium]|nr:transposase [Atribacterota bacterium]